MNLAYAIAAAVTDKGPVFQGEDGVRTASVLVAVGYRESGLNYQKVGDCPGKKAGDEGCGPARATAWGAFQRSVTGGRWTLGGVEVGPALLEDPYEQAAEALAHVRKSAKTCPKEPLVYYIGWEGSCDSARPVRISRDRMRLAKDLVSRTVVRPLTEEKNGERTWKSDTKM